MPFHRIRLLFVWFLLLFSSSMVQARPAENRSTYPFNASISVSGQSVYLSDYADEFNTPVTLSITCIDPSISSIQVKLVVGIRSGGFSCKSSSYAVTTPITMSFGDRYVLSSEQVASYFKAHNLQVTGLVNGRIPEGLAEFSVEVQEYHSGTKLSAMAYTMRQLKLLSPPRLQSPTNGRRVDETKANNLLFTWSPVFVPTGQTIQYEFILKELADTLSAAQTAFNYAPVVYTEKTNLSSLIYSIDKPMLETGKKYGWCIKASVDGMGSNQAANSYFTNAGYSEIFCFTIKDTEQQNDSPIATAEKPTEEDNPNCGVAPQIDLSNTTPIETLQVGDTIMAGDFPVVLLEVTGSGGIFSGKGSVDIPYISKALRFAVEFDGIGVNTDKRLISGQITAVQNASLDNIANLDAIDYGATRTIEKAVTSADVSLGVALPNAPPPSIHYDQSSNKLTFYNATGGVIAETTLNNPQGGKVFPITVKDEQGNLYQIDEVQNSDSTTHHTLTALGKQEGVLPYKSYNTSGIDASVAVVTFEPLDSPYSFDTFKDYYKDIPLIYKQNTLQADLRYPYMGYDYYTPWQFIPLGERVTLTAKLKINDKKAGIDPSKVIFRTEEGLVLPATYNPKNNTYTLTIPSAQSEGYYLLHALYQTGIKDYLHFGQIGIDTRKPITAKVVLVPMGGGYHASELQNQINAITEQVGLTWQVEEMSGFEVTEEVTQHLFEKESHDLFSYNDAQKALNSAFKSHLGSKYDASACYVFMFDKAPVKGDRNIIGFMPRGGQYGYVHCSKLSSEELATILAHELMHGQFLLRHTFDDKYKKDLKQGVNPDNLMDYKGGTHIAKWQWDQIYDPAITTSLIKYDEEGEFVITTTAIITYLTKFGISTALNIGTDLLINRLVHPDVHSWEEAWEQVNCWRAMLNGAIDIIPAKKFKYAAEFVGDWVICLAEKNSVEPADLGGCGLSALVDIIFDEIQPHQQDLALSRIKEIWPDKKVPDPKLGKKQHANAPPAKVGKLSKRLANYPKLNKKLTELGELKDKFVEDFDDLTDDQIDLFEQNPNLVDSWKRLAQCKAPDDLRKNIGAIKTHATDIEIEERPDPSTYLPKEYIEAHMKKFEKGAAMIKTEYDLKKYPNIGHSEKFVSNPESIEKIVREANGDLRKIEKALGLKKGDLGEDTKNVYIIYIKPEQIKNARMPSGNESGANDFWIPGGCTASEDAMGIPEIVIDCTELPKDLFDIKYNNKIPLNNFK